MFFLLHEKHYLGKLVTMIMKIQPMSPSILPQTCVNCANQKSAYKSCCIRINRLEHHTNGMYWELCVLYKLYKYELYRATTCFCPRSALMLGRNGYSNHSLYQCPYLKVDITYQNGVTTKSCVGAPPFTRFDQRLLVRFYEV